MNCFDSTFVIDYLSGEEATVDYLEDRSNEGLYLPAVVLHEGIQCAVEGEGSTDIRKLVADLGWMEVAPFTRTTAIEAGRLQQDLQEKGAKLSPVDAMVAGTAKDLGATLVTRDSDFSRDEVREALDVRSY